MNIKLLSFASFLVLAHQAAIAQSWLSLPQVFTPSAEVGVVRVSPGSANSAWAIMATPGLQVSVPYCLKAANSNTAWSLSALMLPTDWTPVSISGLDASTAWVAAYSLATEDSGHIYKTTDGGVSWTQQSTAQFGDAVQLLHFFNANDGVAIGKLSVFTTANGGTNWTKKSNLPTPGGFGTGCAYNAIEVRNNTIWIGDVAGSFYKSTDKGNTWARMSGVATGYSVTGIAFRDSLNGLATVERFVNGGGSGSGGSGGYYTDDAHYYRTTDGGNTWTQATYNFTGLSAQLQAKNISAESKFDIGWLPGSANTYVISSAATTGYSAISKDNGASWQLLDSNTMHLGLAFTSQTAGISGGVINTTQSGIFSWQNTASGVTVPHVSSITYIPSYPNPAAGQLYVAPGNVPAVFHYEITDITGKAVREGNILCGITPAGIQLDGLRSGNYMIHLSSGAAEYASRFVKQ